MTRMLNVALVALGLALAGGARAQPHEDVKSAPSCPHCGMDRLKFAHSRMLVEYDDGGKVGLCSLHCAGVELAVAIDRTPKAIWVADRGTGKLIDAEKAVWVLGGSAPGVMTARAKWAFEDRGAAEAFIQANGGTLATFDAAMKATYEDMYQDSKMIREKRKMKRTRTGAGAPPAEAHPAAGHPGATKP